MRPEPTAARPLARDDIEIPEHRPGEPVPLDAGLVRLAFRALVTGALFVATSWLWPVYLVLAARYGWAPTAPHWWQVRRYLRLVWESDAPHLQLGDRLWLSHAILRVCGTAPLHGAAWHLDEWLYGDALREVEVVEPLIEISAARSGSTQLARYIERDPSLLAPPFIQCMYPYLWLWRLVGPTLGRVVPVGLVHGMIERMTEPEFRERHEEDPFGADTFDLVLLTRHLNPLCLRLGRRAIEEDFSWGALAPHNRSLWEDDFLAILDGVARKTLLDAEPGPDGRPRRLFVKGHFLCAADAVAARYPDGRFLTMIREPAPRLQSTINFLRAAPFQREMGAPAPWRELAAGLAASEARYCELEQEWFTRKAGPRRCVVRFGEYVRDLEGTLAKVYRECLDRELPQTAPREHEPRRRGGYLLDRSLEDLGIDERVLNDRLADYISWCRAPETRAQAPAFTTGAP